jgi:3-oxoacyl-[acyl-carrier-protein] synthase II
MTVVITGFGIQSPLGCHFNEAMEHIKKGKPCVGPIENFDTGGFPVTAAGEVRHNGEVVRTAHQVDRKIFFLDEAIGQLLRIGGLNRRYSSKELFLNMGTGLDYLDSEAYFTNKEYKKAAGENILSHQKTGKAIRALAVKHGLLGGCNTFVAACAASSQAIGFSYRLLKHGYAKAVVAGGSDSMTSHATFIGFYKLGAMSFVDEGAATCKPFDLRRNGTVLGEGAVALALERKEGATPEQVIMEVAGYGSTNDAYAITDPDPSADMLTRSIELALQDAGIGPDQIDCVHLHGTGTPKNAPVEYLALRRAFGERVKELPVYSMKGQMGHLIGSCGAMELLGVAYSFIYQEVPHTVNFSETDPNAPLFVVKDKPMPMPIRYVLKLNASFGGHNTALILKKPKC